MHITKVFPAFVCFASTAIAVPTPWSESLLDDINNLRASGLSEVSPYSPEHATSATTRPSSLLLPPRKQIKVNPLTLHAVRNRAPLPPRPLLPQPYKPNPQNNPLLPPRPTLSAGRTRALSSPLALPYSLLPIQPRSQPRRS